jgi:hypothetical protein
MKATRHKHRIKRWLVSDTGFRYLIPIFLSRRFLSFLLTLTFLSSSITPSYAMRQAEPKETGLEEQITQALRSPDEALEKLTRLASAVLPQPPTAHPERPKGVEGSGLKERRSNLFRDDDGHFRMYKLSSSFTSHGVRTFREGESLTANLRIGSLLYLEVNKPDGSRRSYVMRGSEKGHLEILDEEEFSLLESRGFGVFMEIPEAAWSHPVAQTMGVLLPGFRSIQPTFNPSLQKVTFTLLGSVDKRSLEWSSIILQDIRPAKNLLWNPETKTFRILGDGTDTGLEEKQSRELAALGAEIAEAEKLVASLKFRVATGGQLASWALSDDLETEKHHLKRLLSARQRLLKSGLEENITIAEAARRIVGRNVREVVVEVRGATQVLPEVWLSGSSVGAVQSQLTKILDLQWYQTIRYEQEGDTVTISAAGLEEGTPRARMTRRGFIRDALTRTAVSAGLCTIAAQANPKVAWRLGLLKARRVWEGEPVDQAQPAFDTPLIFKDSRPGDKTVAPLMDKELILALAPQGMQRRFDAELTNPISTRDYNILEIRVEGADGVQGLHVVPVDTRGKEVTFATVRFTEVKPGATRRGRIIVPSSLKWPHGGKPTEIKALRFDVSARLNKSGQPPSVTVTVRVLQSQRYAKVIQAAQTTYENPPVTTYSLPIAAGALGLASAVHAASRAQEIGQHSTAGLEEIRFIATGEQVGVHAFLLEGEAVRLARLFAQAQAQGHTVPFAVVTTQIGLEELTANLPRQAADLIRARSVLSDAIGESAAISQAEALLRRLVTDPALLVRTRVRELWSNLAEQIERYLRLVGLRLKESIDLEKAQALVATGRSA